MLKHHQLMIADGLPPDFCRVAGDRPPASKCLPQGTIAVDSVSVEQAERRAVLAARAKAKATRRIERMKARLAYRQGMVWNATICKWE